MYDVAKMKRPDRLLQIAAGSYNHPHSRRSVDSGRRRSSDTSNGFFMAEDYYKVLGIARSANPDEIQKAYRKLARKYHPDLLNDKGDKEKAAAKQKFQQVQHAYDVLSDPEKRGMYDQFGENFEQMGGAAGGNPFAGAGRGGMGGFEDIFRGMGGAPRGGGGMGGFEEILRQMGGGQRGGPRTAAPPKGQDIEQEITVPFATAVLGGTHQLSLTRHNGKVESLDVKIPAGIETAQKIRLRGQGMPSPAGGPPGDLRVIVKVAPHPNFTRSGLNLNVTVPISLLEAVEGTKIDVSTPHGKVSLAIPVGGSQGKPLRLRGMGIRTKDRSGDLLVALQIGIPKTIDHSDLEKIRGLSESWRTVRRDELTW